MGQYFPGSFTAVALPAVFRQQGLPLEQFWLLSLPFFPRWLKWAMALLVDNYGSVRFGVRKSWIVPTTLLGASLYLAVGFFEPSVATVYVVVGILFVKGFVMGAQDIAVDAYAAESLGDHDRTVGTSVIVFLAFLGGVLGQSCVALIDTWGWRKTSIFAALLLIVAATPATLRREPPPPPAALKRRERGERPNFIETIKREESRLILPGAVGIRRGTIRLRGLLFHRRFLCAAHRAGLSLRRGPCREEGTSPGSP